MVSRSSRSGAGLPDGFGGKIRRIRWKFPEDYRDPVKDELIMAKTRHKNPRTAMRYIVSRELHQTGEGTADLRQLAA